MPEPSVIAQEEFAKGFLLGLVVRGVIPWDHRLLRAARAHVCKKLLCVVMDYLAPDTDEFIDRCNAVVLRREPVVVPARVAATKRSGAGFARRGSGRRIPTTTRSR